MVPGLCVTCSIVIFVCMLIGWRLSNRLYTDVDGAFAKWNFEYAFEWGHWFDLAIFTPFAGVGSTFWSNTPWLNPGELALQPYSHDRARPRPAGLPARAK